MRLLGLRSFFEKAPDIAFRTTRWRARDERDTVVGQIPSVYEVSSREDETEQAGGISRGHVLHIETVIKEDRMLVLASRCKSSSAVIRNTHASNQPPDMQHGLVRA
jgi:hypothetical protein